MKVYRAEQIRNVALISHVSAGKTSLIDSALFDSGAVTRQGKVDEGTSIADFDPEEIKRRITLQVKVLPIEWNDHKINFIDTPGYADLFGEVKAGLRVADAALVVVSAEKSVEVGTELTWQYADERSLPRVVLINKLDRENTSFDQTLEALRNQFGHQVVPLQIPIGEQATFRGVIDLVEHKAYAFESGKPQEIPIPPEMQEQISRYRDELIESAVESDDTIMEKFLDGQALSDEEIQMVVKKGTCTGQLIPVLCGSASKNIGVQPLLDTIIDYLPSPVDAIPEDVKPFKDNVAVFIFKTVSSQVGTISAFRVFSGTLKADSHLYNVQTKVDERMSQLTIQHGKTQEPTSEIPTGDFGAIAKLTASHTNNTLTSNKDTTATLEPIAFPQPCYTVAITAHNQGDLDKMVVHCPACSKRIPRCKFRGPSSPTNCSCWARAKSTCRLRCNGSNANTI